MLAKARYVLLALIALNLGASFAYAQDGPEAPVRLDTLWEMQLGTDYTSTTNPTERDQHPYVGLFYLPSGSADVSGTAIPGLVPLYRLLNSSGSDHMDSTVAGEGGYTTEGAIAYIWTRAAKPGLSGVTRYYDSLAGTANAGDHATVVDSSPIPHAQILPNYSLDGVPLGYGYARYPGVATALASVAGGGVEVKSNVVTGCAVWEWWWQGIEFINDYDYGRQLSTAVYYPFNATPSNMLQEAGDSYGEGDPGVVSIDTAHPSPCVTLSTSGNTQVTAAVPLDWNPANSTFGGGIDNPVIYPDVTIGKNLTLNWIGPDGVNRNWPLAMYESVVTSTTAMGGNFTVESPTAYLNYAFNSYYYYNSSTNSFAFIPSGKVTGTGYITPGAASGPQAVILSSGTAANSPAMGVFINTKNAGFTLYLNGSCTTLTGAACQYNSSFSKWTVVYGGPLASPWIFKTWIVTDTLQNVETDINQLIVWANTTTYSAQMTSL